MDGAKSVYLYPKISSEISPVRSTLTSVFSWIYLHTMYIPIDALIVVMSYVPRSLITFGSSLNTSSFDIYTSVWSDPIKSATCFAYFKSIASFSIPIANVFIGLSENFCATAHTRDESSPPDKRNPTGASESSLFFIPATNLSWMFLQAVSTSSLITSVCLEMSL